MQGTSNERVIAGAFVDARRSGTAIAQFPGNRPSDLAGAYRVQDIALSLWDRKIGGWKVGRIGKPADERLGANRLVGPVFADTIVDGCDAVRGMPIFSGGFAAAESEFMIRLKVPDGKDLPRNEAETLDWIEEARIGIEIASSPYPGVNADGPCVTVSDHGNNAGIVLGPMVPRENLLTLDSIEVETVIDGVSVGKANTSTMLDGPLGAVRFLLANLQQRGIAPQDGWWVSSGAITGVHEVEAGSHIIARFAGIGEVECKVEPA